MRTLFSYPYLSIEDCDMSGRVRSLRVYAVILSAVIFIVGGCSALAYAKYLQDGNTQIIQDETQRFSDSLAADIENYMLNKTQELHELEKLWQTIEGPSESEWVKHAETRNDEVGLRTVEWADKSFHIRWVNPLEGNENVIGMSIIFDKKREAALKEAGRKNTVILTPPLDLVQGYKAVIMYVPIYLFNQFNGFVIGIFDLRLLIESMAALNVDDRYKVDLFVDDELIHSIYRTRKLFSSHKTAADGFYSVSKEIVFHDKHWSVRLTPTHDYVRHMRYILPMYAFMIGLAGAVGAAAVCFALVTWICRMRRRKKEAQNL